MAAPNQVTVTVQGVDGTSIMGPTGIAREGTVKQLRTRVINAPNGFNLGEEVEMRDEGNGICMEEWETGTVTSLNPLKVMHMSAKAGRSWHEVRSLNSLSRTCDVKLFFGARWLADAETLSTALGEVEAAVLLAIVVPICEEQRFKCKRAIANLAGEKEQRVLSCDEDEIDEDEEKEWLQEEVTKLLNGFSEAELADREIMTKATTTLGTGALQYAGTTLKDDAEFIISIVKTGYGAQDIMQFASKALKANSTFMTDVASHNINLLRFADASVKLE